MVAIQEKPQVRLYSFEEYFDLEKRSDIKHEFVNGKLFPMPGEARNANEIVNNCVDIIRKPLKKRGFLVYSHDVRTVISEGERYRYPDVVVTHVTDDSDNYHVKFPIFLLEVTSEKSSTNDRKTKLQEYTQLDSAQFYLIVDQNEVSVEVYTREGKRWIYEQFKQLDDVINLPIFDIQMPLSAIYEDIVFESET